MNKHHTKSYYHNLYERCGEILTESFEKDSENSFNDNHNFISDFATVIDCIGNNLESQLFQNAVKEYQYGLLSVLFGQYRQSFMSLRLFLELSISAIVFSANELELRTWLNGNRDVYWRSMMDNDNGVFSRKFVSAFFGKTFESSIIELIKDKAETSYRECSEFAHGNVATMSELPKNLEFDALVFEKWQDLAKTIREVVMFAFTIRYIGDLSEQQLISVEQTIIDEIGYITEIRRYMEQRIK